MCRPIDWIMARKEQALGLLFTILAFVGIYFGAPDSDAWLNVYMLYMVLGINLLCRMNLRDKELQRLIILMVIITQALFIMIKVEFATELSWVYYWIFNVPLIGVAHGHFRNCSGIPTYVRPKEA